VQSVTNPDSDTFVQPAGRIAAFDNDGCLWAEQPAYFQLLFAVERIKALADDHPEWKETEPFKSALAGDMKSVMVSGEDGILKIVAASHTGLSTEAFKAEAAKWLKTARHPIKNCPYTELVYPPQLELLEYLRANEFKTYIVSGGGIDFLRVFAEEAYGIPPEQVVGSSVAVRYELREGVPTLIKLSEGLFINDKGGKPVGIYQHVGRRPVIAVGNSDGDFQMLEWTTAGEGPRLGVLIHHDDADREWAYDRDSHIGRLDRGLDEAEKRGWIVVSMKEDWKTIFPEQD
jgi:phosphoglycolate phosphatase-like HAD superfamily hydrolase